MTGVFVEDPEKKDQIGWAMIILTIVNFAANIMPILIGILCVYKLRCRRCLNKCAHEAKMKEQEEKARLAKLAEEADAMSVTVNKFLNGELYNPTESEKSKEQTEESSYEDESASSYEESSS